MMKFLHTSDWHIGRNLHGRRRHDETQAFLSWLEETIRRREIDALLVAGDVFDSIAPGNTAQGLYYRFLSRLAATPCRHVVVIGGNHDSPSFLNAPRELLKALDVHVVGCATDGPAAEVLQFAELPDPPRTGGGRKNSSKNFAKSFRELLGLAEGKQ